MIQNFGIIFINMPRKTETDKKCDDIITGSGTAAFIIAFIVMFITDNLWTSFIVFWIAFVIIIIIAALSEVVRIDRIDTNLKTVDNMSGKEFEEFMEVLFKNLDFEVHRTPIVGDYGIDLILTDKNGKRIAVQLKRYKGKVGTKAIQEAYSGANFYGIENITVVTNSYFTEQAKEMARKLGIELIDRKELNKLLERAKKT